LGSRQNTFENSRLQQKISQAKCPASQGNYTKIRRLTKLIIFTIFMGMTRLTIEIEPEQHRQIKTLATFASMTIKEFILSKTLGSSSESSSQTLDTTTRLLGAPENAKRLREAIDSETPKHLIFETTEDLKRALGI
jgi:hypothetical protein